MISFFNQTVKLQEVGVFKMCNKKPRCQKATGVSAPIGIKKKRDIWELRTYNLS